jgi:hypothetical protein
MLNKNYIVVDIHAHRHNGEYGTDKFNNLNKNNVEYSIQFIKYI